MTEVGWMDCAHSRVTRLKSHRQGRVWWMAVVLLRPLRPLDMICYWRRECRFHGWPPKARPRIRLTQLWRMLLQRRPQAGLSRFEAVPAELTRLEVGCLGQLGPWCGWRWCG